VTAKTEQFLAVLKGPNAEKDAKALAVWLYKVAKTQCLMSRRKSKFAPA
jgi:hypothetical protein